MKTVTPSVTLWARCDVCDKADHWVNLDVSKAEDDAKAEGWSLSHERDLCPTCLKQTN